ncbi:hypothetical protein M413DRAFT_247120 [Hebeloma cylindrosporum]|uniref:Protein kinase domain-containing protein n=1 Tax=Hebeloma cylindrosporum TaxID=76867 RepID=A0A0C2XK89_HEBCY|nr:hypothetical protein M413DRAFT_247120 [Hebeloma cylindrosporum h7]
MNLDAALENDIRADPVDYSLRREWWESKRTWFADRGYVLNKTIYGDSGRVWAEEPMSTSPVMEVRYPDSYVGGCKACQPACTLPHTQLHPRIAMAQDRESRHVVIKVILSESEEFKVLKLLQQETDLSEQFRGIIPVLDMLPSDAFCFVVLPRWGGKVYFSWFETAKDVLHYIRCLLQGLAFLHDRRIFHRDVTAGNILANHFSCFQDCESFDRKDMRADLRKADLLNYALNDFDLSMLLPSDACLKTFRLPIVEIYPGVWDKPHEAIRGEIDFNPFAYDVGCLGIEFAHTFQHLCPSIPFLAPLIDGMVNSHVPARFTAQEALNFLDEAQSEMTGDQLAESPDVTPQFVLPFDEFDRWSDLPSSLIEKWGRYRECRPSRFATHIIHPLCMRPWGTSLVYYTRLTFRRAFLVCSLPLRLSYYILSFF